MSKEIFWKLIEPFRAKWESGQPWRTKKANSLHTTGNLAYLFSQKFVKEEKLDYKKKIVYLEFYISGLKSTAYLFSTLLCVSVDPFLEAD